MDHISKEEFLSWLDQVITKKVQRNINRRVMEEKLMLADRAGRNKEDDLFRSGLLQGMALVSNFEDLFDFTEEGKDASSSGTQGPY
jgi:hypothetical protein